MATTEHCLFCFETLAARLEHQDGPSLQEVEQQYAAYTASKGGPNKAVAAASAASGHSSSASSASASSASLGASTPASTSTYASTAVSAQSSSSVPDSPLFVTWNTTEGEPAGEHILRGCIGTFEAQPIEDGLAAYALTAALRDTRFRPVSWRELPYLQVAVTLLTDFEPATGGVEDWTLGKHGLRISFVADKRRYSATYLPDVAPEQGWTKEETLVSLMRKAGWSGRKDKWREVDVKVTRYQGKKAELSYEEYKEFKDWVDSQ